MVNRIPIPVDGSTTSDRSREEIVKPAKLTGAPMHSAPIPVLVLRACAAAAAQA
jgi:hypothetical protein